MTPLSSSPRPLYPEIEPNRSGWLQVSDLHEIYWEESGNPTGVPVLFLHGGPGGGTEPKHRRFFDPRHYRIILLDQRGCGRSRPFASLVENTTWHLVDDLERVREFLGVDRWHVFGGSWGSTLALVYARQHRERVLSLVLRGIFTFSRREMDWFYGHGTRTFFPDAYAQFERAIPGAERSDLLRAYYRRLTDSDPSVRNAAARAWATWECSVATLLPDREILTHCSDAGFTLAFARIECHYFVNHGFFDRDNQLLDGVHTLRDIPAVVVHGRYDVICPLQNAWELHRRWPEADLVIVPGSGHAATERDTASALVAATDRFRDLRP